MSYWRIEGDDALLFVRLTPRAKQERILGIENSRLRISLNAPPVDGAANKALIAFLAKSLNLPKSRITLERGKKSREKTLRLSGFCDDLALENLGKTP